MNSFFYPEPAPMWCNYCQYCIPNNGKLYREKYNYNEARLNEDKQENRKEGTAANAYEKPQTDMYPHDEAQKEVSKDDLVSGFVPDHNHGSVDYTSIVDGHVHQCLDITFPPTPSEGGTHVHYTEGYVLFEDGHNHHYKAWSGPAIPVGEGMHVHYYDFYTTVNDGHRHHVKGTDMAAPGTI